MCCISHKNDSFALRQPRGQWRDALEGPKTHAIHWRRLQGRLYYIWPVVLIFLKHIIQISLVLPQSLPTFSIKLFEPAQLPDEQLRLIRLLWYQQESSRLGHDCSWEMTAIRYSEARSFDDAVYSYEAGIHGFYMR